MLILVGTECCAGVCVSALQSTRSLAGMLGSSAKLIGHLSCASPQQAVDLLPPAAHIRLLGNCAPCKPAVDMRLACVQTRVLLLVPLWVGFWFSCPNAKEGGSTADGCKPKVASLLGLRQTEKAKQAAAERLQSLDEQRAQQDRRPAYHNSN